MSTKTEQYAYPFNHHLHSMQSALDEFFNKPLTLEEQRTQAEKLLVGANRLHIMLTSPTVRPFLTPAEPTSK